MPCFLNALGIYWQGGHLTNQQLPAVHPPLEQRYMTRSYRSTYAVAWSLYSDPTTLVLVGPLPRRSTLRLRQHLAHYIYIDAVAGPFVFLDSGEGDGSDAMNGNVQVLDTRTGAIAEPARASGCRPPAPAAPLPSPRWLATGPRDRQHDRPTRTALRLTIIRNRRPASPDQPLSHARVARGGLRLACGGSGK